MCFTINFQDRKNVSIIFDKIITNYKVGNCRDRSLHINKKGRPLRQPFTIYFNLYLFISYIRIQPGYRESLRF
jgi:hypothetical protein